MSRRRTRPNSVSDFDDPTYQLAERLVDETEHVPGREERLRQNSIPPRPKSYPDPTDLIEWADVTFEPGTPVRFRRVPEEAFEARTMPGGAWGWTEPDWAMAIPKDARGKVLVDEIKESGGGVYIPVEIVDARSPYGDRIDDLIGKQGYFEESTLEPLADNWAQYQGARGVGRHRLPRSQRSRLKPNDDEKERSERFARAVYQEVLRLRGFWRKGEPVSASVRYSIQKMLADHDEEYSRGFAQHADPKDVATAIQHAEWDRTLTENRRRSHRGAAMDTHFGRTIDDPDSEGGGAVDAAMDRYEIFHDKAPIRIAELDHDLPTKWVKTGECLAVMYRTDKWKKDGDDEDYKHLHDAGDDKPYPLGKGVKFFEPAAEVSKSRVAGKRRTSRHRSQRLPVAAPKAITLLGYCLGFFVRRDDDGEIYELNPRGAWLFSSPSGNMLCVYSPRDGFLGAMAGGKLRVLKDGIDG